MAAPVSTGNSALDLSIRSGGGVTVNASITNTGTGSMGIDTGVTAGDNITINAPISMSGGSIHLSTNSVGGTITNNSTITSGVTGGALGVYLSSDIMNLYGTGGAISATGGMVVLSATATAPNIDLGAITKGTAGTLELSAADLSTIDAGTKTVAAKTGSITVSQALSTSAPGVSLIGVAANDITVNAPITNTYGDVVMMAGWDGNKVTPGVTLGTGNLVLNDSVFSGGSLSLLAGNAITLNQGTPSGSIAITHNTNWGNFTNTYSGSYTSGGDLTLLAGGAINLHADLGVTGNGNTLMIAGWDGNTSTPGVVGYTPGRDITTSGTIFSAGSGNMTLTAADAINITPTGGNTWFAGVDMNSGTLGMSADKIYLTALGNNGQSPSARISSNGDQNFTLTGGSGATSKLSLTGANGAGSYGGEASIERFGGSGGQNFTFNNGSSLELKGGSGGGFVPAHTWGGDCDGYFGVYCSGNRAGIENQAAGGQTFTFSAGSNLTLTGGSVGNGNNANIYNKIGTQTISGNPVITLTGGSSGGAMYYNDGSDPWVGANTTMRDQYLDNGAGIDSDNNQIIHATSITLDGGGATFGSAWLGAPTQSITTTGKITLIGGTAAAPTAFTYVAGAGGGIAPGTYPTSGELIHTTAAFIGYDVNAAPHLNVGGNLIMTGGAINSFGGSVAMIGSVYNSADVIINATGYISMTSALINAGAGNINLTAGGTITEGVGGSIVTAGTLTTSAVGGTTLAGGNAFPATLAATSANAIAKFVATDTSGIVLTNTAPTLTLGAITAGGTLLVNNYGNLTVARPIAINGTGVPAGLPPDVLISGGLSALGMFTNNSTITLATGSQGLILVADKMTLAEGSISAPGSIVILNTNNTSDLTDLGSTLKTTPNTLELSQADLASISSPNLMVVVNNDLKITAPISVGTKTLYLNTNGSNAGPTNPSGTIAETGSGSITAGTLITNSVGGTTLNGANAVSSFGATDTGVVSLMNTAVTLGLNAITSAGLTVNNRGTINANGNISAGTFTLSGGTWNQVAATLPNFTVNDFRIAGGTFIRALGGNGGIDTPYQLADIYGVQGMGSAGMLGNAYALANNIDASGTVNWNAGAGFVPVGNNWNTRFSGTFDGTNHTISGLIINLPATDLVGLFGITYSGSVVRNIGLVGGAVSGYLDVGGLVGSNSGTVSNVYSTGAVSGTDYVGGLVGYHSGTVSNAYSTGAVSGTGRFVGGLVGYNNGGSTVSNAYSTGAVSGTGWYVGGLVGYNFIGTVSNAYSTGAVSGTNYVGGLVGFSYLGTVSNSHYDINSVAINNVTGTYVTLGGLYAAQYQDWLSHGLTLDIANYSASLSGSGNNYIISSVQGLKDLLGFADNPALHFSLAGNLDLASAPNLHIPYLAGSFDGAGFTVSNLNVNQPFSSRLGLLGYVGSGGAVSNVGLLNATVSGTDFVGGLVGANSGTVSNAYSTGAVSGTNYVGGLVGYNSGTVSNAYSTGAVSGSSCVGGLVGFFYSGTVSNAYSTGAVRGLTGVGGLVGFNYYYGTASNSFWDTQTSGQPTSAGGTGLITTQMMQLSSFTGWSIANTGGAGATWRIYEGSTTPLLTSFLTPITVTANADSKTYDGSAYSGGNGVTYSDVNAVLSGTVAYGGTSQGAVNAGGYIIAPSGFYSNQQGYDISYANGALTINPLAVNIAIALAGNKVYDGTPTFSTGQLGISNAVSGDVVSLSAGTADTADKNVGVNKPFVSFAGLALTGASAGNYTLTGVSGTGTITQLGSVAYTGASGNWSNAANWAGGALPDGSNVAAVTIPSGVTVTYDSGVVGTTSLNSLTSNGNFAMAAGTLSTSGNLSTAGYQQTGGTLNVGGNMSVTQSFAKAAGATGSLVLTGANSTISINQSVGDLVFYNDHAIRLGAVNSAGNLLIDTTGGSITTTGNIINAAGNLNLSAASDITITDAWIHSVGNMGVEVGGNLTLAAATSNTSLGSNGIQTINFTGSGVAHQMRILGGNTAGVGGASASIWSSGLQTINYATTGGSTLGILVAGGSATQNIYDANVWTNNAPGALICSACATWNWAGIHSEGGQTITASTITVNGGSGGNGNWAGIENRSTSVTQSITTTGLISLTGGTAPGYYNPDVNDSVSNEAGIHSQGTQTISAGSITLNGGGDANSRGGAFITGKLVQDITTTGDLSMTGGTSNNSFDQYMLGAPAIIGEKFGAAITINIGGNLTMTGGAGSASPTLIGSAQGAPSINITATGISMTSGGASSGIGVLTGGPSGTLSMTATAGNITQDAFSEINTSSLATSSTAGTTLLGANTVGSFSATNSGTGNIDLTNTATNLALAGISNTAATGGVTVNNTGAISTTGNVTASGSINIAATGGDFTQASGIISNATGVAGLNDITLGGVNITLHSVQSQRDVVLNATGNLNLLGINNGNYIDDEYFVYNLPFTFNYFGTPYTQAFITTNGLITFGSGTREYADSIARLGNYRAIAPAWNDWVIQASYGKDIRILPGADNLSVLWDVARCCGQVSTASSTARFEAVLNSTGSIKFNYGAANSSFAGDVTIGLSNGVGTTLASQLINEPNFSLNNLRSTTFTPNGSGSYTETLAVSNDALHPYGPISGSVILGRDMGFVVTANFGNLGINAGSNVNVDASINAATFTLSGGTWNQVSAMLPGFTVNDFRIAGGTFIRALGGDGSIGSPYQLADIYGVQGMGSAGMLGNAYALANNIDASGTVNWNAGAGFAPVGNNGYTSFTGTFDGTNHTINNLVINLPATNYVGLFGNTGSDSVVRNIGIVGGAVSGGAYGVGGLVGYNHNRGTVSNAYSTGSVSGSGDVGGLAGYNDGTISNSYSTGAVSGTNWVGGLVGNNGGTVSNAYSTSAVSGTSLVGGLVGVNRDTVSNSFWDITTSGQATSAGGTGLTTAQMMQIASFSSWNTATPNTISNTGGSGAVWRIYEGHTAPLLTSFMTGLTLTDAPDVAVTYNGSAQSGASTVIAGVLGAAATGTNAGFYNGYYSTQQGYDITGGNLTINPLAVNIAIALAGNKVYDGTPTFSTGQLGISNAVSGDVVSLSAGTADTADKNVGVNKPFVSFAGLALTGASAGNYTLTGVSGTGTITPAALTITANAASKPYNGLAYSGGNGVTYSGLVNGETNSVLGGTLAYGGSSQGAVYVGSYTITPSGLTSGNYSINFSDGALTVNPDTLPPPPVLQPVTPTPIAITYPINPIVDPVVVAPAPIASIGGTTGTFGGVDTSVENIQAQIASGGDPTQVAPASASGNSGNGNVAKEDGTKSNDTAKKDDAKNNDAAKKKNEKPGKC